MQFLTNHSSGNMLKESNTRTSLCNNPSEQQFKDLPKFCENIIKQTFSSKIKSKFSVKNLYVKKILAVIFFSSCRERCYQILCDRQLKLKKFIAKKIYCTNKDKMIISHSSIYSTKQCLINTNTSVLHSGIWLSSTS
jgi:hypothetical protein